MVIPRLSIEIGEDVDKKLSEHIPWGMKSVVFRTLAEQVAELTEKDSGNAFKIISGKIVLAEK
jgi:hypothetical protein